MYNHSQQPVTSKSGIIVLLAVGLMTTVTQAQPTITQQPTNQTVVPGANATFNVVASGTGPFSYQWRYNGTNIPAGIIRTIAGNGTAGYSGDNIAATNAELQSPFGVVVDNRGRVFIADNQNFRVRMVDTNGLITTVAGNGSSGNPTNGAVATNAPLGSIVGLAVDNAGNLFLSDQTSKAIRKVNTNGIIATVSSGFALNEGLCVDANGNIFLADQGKSFPPTPARILEVATNGAVSTVAGGGSSYPGNGGSATGAALHSPDDVAVDSTGQLFIAEQGVVCKVDTNGIIWTVASAGQATGVEVDASGNVFFADNNSDRAYEVMAVNGSNFVAAGNGTVGYSGDNGVATNAQLSNPLGIALDGAGDVFISDNNNSRVREVTGIPAYPGNLPTFFVANTSPGNTGNYSVIVTSPGGSVTSSPATLIISDPPLITTQPASQLVFAGQPVSLNTVAQGGQPISYQWYFNGTTLGGETNPVLSFPSISTNNAGIYVLVASNSYASATSAPAQLMIAAPLANNQVWSAGSTITLDPGNSLGGWQYQWQHNGVGVGGDFIITIAGKGLAGYAGDNGAATNSKLNSPSGVVMDSAGNSAGNVFIADYFNSLIRKVDTSGTITTVAGLVTNGNFSSGYSGDGHAATNAQLYNPDGVALDAAGDLFIADSGNNCVRKVDTNGIITTVAGNGNIGYSGDGGAATSAQLASPTGVAVDSTGNLYIADFYNSLVRKVDTNGTITTFAGLVTNGSPQYGYSGDGGAATNAELDAPSSLVLDAAGNVLIADSANNSIRKVTTNGIITTVAGNGSGGYSGDGDLATNSTLSSPAGVVLDATGNMFISDNGNNRIRKVNPAGIITTVAGNGNTGYSGDNGLATNAALNSTVGIALDANANVLIADAGNNRVRKVLFQGPALTLHNAATTDTGGYRLIVTGPFGSFTSSVVNVGVITLPQIYQSTLNNDRSITLGLMNLSGSPGVVTFATNLSAPVWQPVYTNSTGGIWQYTDTNTAGTSRKYYRLLGP
jgi:sugar lactone lactonase YvrE